jgi:transcriptional regulator NrdR family protein
MVCIYCDSKTKTAVINSRVSAKFAAVWRRRSCPNCASIFTTREQVDYQNALRVVGVHGVLGTLGKPSTSHDLKARKRTSLPAKPLEPFQRDRLFLSVYNSLSHRKTALNDATQLTDTIIAQLLLLQSNGVIHASLISKTTAKTLKHFDSVSGIHYSAHHLS